MAACGEDSRSASDGEVDSEVEDNDMEKEFGHWLEQLESVSKDGQKNSAQHKPVTITPQQVVESFRNSVLLTKEGEADLDAILGDLCALEAQLTSTQSELDYSLQKTCDLPQPKQSLNMALENKPVFNYDWDDAIDSQLQGALNALTDLSTNESDDNRIQKRVRNNQNVTSSQTQYSDWNAYYSTGASSIGHNSVSKSASSQLTAPKVGLNQSTNSSPEISILSGGYHSFNQDLSPTSLDTDSAYSDSISLPSSGSHISVATSGSGGSHGSTGSGNRGAVSSGVSSGVSDMHGPASPSHTAVRMRLQSLQDDMDQHQLPSDEQSTKLKEEKIKIALEKIKQANVKKLFVRAHTADGGSKSILVDESMTVANIIDKLVVKNHGDPNLNWAIVEHLPELYMERLLEDHENLVECMMNWATVSPNMIFFIERIDKYDVFLRPEEYVIADKPENEIYDPEKRRRLIQEYFSDNAARCPEIDGMLHLKTEGKKVWRKYFCVLRSSGLYYNPKGKSKSSKDLVCLQKIDLADIYTSVGWKKKYKAPNEFGFALKHPQIQKKSSKYIKYFCAEDCRTMARWVTAIRIAKHGCQLRRSFEIMQNSIATFETRDIVPNPNFNEYIAQHEQVVERFSKRGNKINHSESDKNTNKQSRRSSLKKEESIRKSPSKSSIKSKSDINVVILDRRQSSDMDSNPNIVVLHKRASGNYSQNSLEILSPDRTGSHGSLDSGSYRNFQTESQSIESNSHRSLDSLDSKPHRQSESVANVDSPMRNTPVSTPGRPAMYGSPREENFKNVPIKMIPSLPVNTQITKYLTEQTGVAGTLNRQTLRRMKKSMSQEKDFDECDLPPPPLDLPPAPDPGQPALKSPIFPPPPPQQTLEGISADCHRNAPVMDTSPAKHLLEISPVKNSAVKKPPEVAKKPTLEDRYDSSGYMTVKSAGKLHTLPNPISNTGTIKRAPPPPPKRKPDSGVREQHYAVSTVTPGSGHGYDTPKPVQCSEACYGTNIRGFVNDLSRVVQDKHTALGVKGVYSNHTPVAMVPPQPPPPRPEGVQPLFVPEDLPPPPAELLEELKELRQRPRQPPPPPRRQ